MRMHAPMVLFAETCRRRAGESIALPMTCRNVSTGIAWTICDCRQKPHNLSEPVTQLCHGCTSRMAAAAAEAGRKVTGSLTDALVIDDQCHSQDRLKLQEEVHAGHCMHAYL